MRLISCCLPSAYPCTTLYTCVVNVTNLAFKPNTTWPAWLHLGHLQQAATWHASPITCVLLCLRSYGLIKVDLQEAELDVPDRYTASVAIGEQVLPEAPLTHVESCTTCRATHARAADGNLRSLCIAS